MTTQTLKLSQIETSDKNPRKRFDEDAITGLAQSIKTDGLLQNLVVAKPKGKKKKHPIICGERRFRALKLLQKQGDLMPDYEVSVEIKTDLSDEEAHRMATMENVQRANFTPLEEAEAVASLLQEGVTLDEVISQTGLSEGVIKRRLVLSSLCEDVKTALNEEKITLSQAEALTLGTEDQQKEILEEGLEGYGASQIKGWLTEEKANVAMAVFDVSQYSGTFTSDLFADEATTYFDDVEQFNVLQEKAVEELSEKYQADGFDPVEVIEGYGFSNWKYREASEGEKGGVVIHVRSNGHVETHEGIVNRDLERQTDEATNDNPFAGKKPKPKYGVPLMRYMAMHKSIALQKALIENPRIAKEVAVTQMIAGGDWVNPVSLNTHGCLSYFEDEQARPSAWHCVEAEAQALSELLALEDGDMACTALIQRSHCPATWYEAVKALSDANLERLHLFLTVLCFGQGNVDRLDTNENSLFNSVAKDLSIDMCDYWCPDADFMKRRNKDQLQDIITETSSSVQFGMASQHKKKDLVSAMAKHFGRVRTLEAPNADELKAIFWLPKAMAFPAVDPNAKDAPEVEDTDALDEDETLEDAA